MEPYYEGCCEDEDLNAVGRPEVGYRLMVNERSLVSLSAVGDFAPIVGIFSECGPASAELGCGVLGTARVVLDPGVYTAYVAGMEDEEAGPYELSSSIQPVSTIATACTAVTRELESGVAVRANTTRAEDNFSGECGGAGVGEDTYRLVIAEPSRVRCHVDGFDAPVLYARSTCEYFESEVGCSFSAPLHLVAEPGTLFISVDGTTQHSRGEYELLCEVVPIPASVEGNLCASAQTVDLSERNTSLEVDFLLEPGPVTSLCSGRERAPEALYRFELSEDTYVQASGAGLLVALNDECAQTACSPVTGAAERLSAGAHYLIARAGADCFRSSNRQHSQDAAGSRLRGGDSIARWCDWWWCSERTFRSGDVWR